MALSLDVSKSETFLLSLASKAPFLAILFFTVVSLVALDHDLKVEHDAGVYIALGKSLSTGQGYKEIFFVDAPPHTKYPPVFSLLLAPLIALFDLNFLAMKLMVVAMGILALYLTYVFHRAVTDDLIASLVVIFTATSHGIVFYSQSILTEIPYLLFSLLALFWLQKCSSRGTWSGKAAAIAVILIPLVYLTRLIGLSLLLATVAYLLFESPGGPGERVRRATTIGVIAAVPALAWFLRNWWIGELGGTSYWRTAYAKVVWASPDATGLALTLFSKVEVNLKKYVLAHARVIFFDYPRMSETLLPVLLTLVIFGGFVWCVLRKRTILEYYVFFCMGGVLLFPATRPQRYIVPLIPFIWYYFFTASRQIFSYLSRRAFVLDPARQRQVVLTATLVLLLALLVSNGWMTVVANGVYRGREGYYHVVGEDEYKEAALWAKTHIPPDSVIMWAKPSLRFLVSGRKAAEVQFRRSDQETLQYIRAKKVDYVILDSFSEVVQSKIGEVVEKHPDDFRLVYAEKGSRGYKVTYPK